MFSFIPADPMLGGALAMLTAIGIGWTLTAFLLGLTYLAEALLLGLKAPFRLFRQGR